MRKLVTVQKIGGILPMDADSIVAYKVRGWTVVDQIGKYQVGDHVAFFEVDSFLPSTNPAFESFLARGIKTVAIDGKDVTGHVLKTIRLRGVVSQGLVLSLDKLGFASDLSVGTDLTESLGVVKWEPPLPSGTNIIGTFQTRFVPKTDAVRLQNLTEYWDLIKTIDWEPTVKVDGTSQTLVNDNGTVRLFGRNWELDTSSAGGFAVAERVGLVDVLLPGMAIQFEFVGPGIQANRLKLQEQKAVVFAVWQDGEKLPRSVWPQIALDLAAPILGSEWSLAGDLDELINRVATLRGSVTKDVLDEGIVWHPIDPSSVPTELTQVLDRNCNVKIVSWKWLLKGGE